MTRMSKIKAVLSKAVAAVTISKPAKVRERTRGFWPDDDLEELEHPRRRDGWLGHVGSDWLQHRRR
jgi:hypothetical protein